MLKRRMAIALFTAFIVVACNAATPTPPPPVVTVRNVNDPTATVKPAPGVTLVAPPTAAQNPTSTPATANPTAIPNQQYGPDSYPENINPLTGEQVDVAKLNRIPVAVKISNFPLSVRPQFGLAAADIVFEHLAEAGLTRFTAIFLQNDADKVGSIRSARFIDYELAQMFQMALVTSGSSQGTMEHLRKSPWFTGDGLWRLVSEATRYQCPPLCRETSDDTNTLFANTASVREQIEVKSGQKYGRADLKGLAFNVTPPNGNNMPKIEQISLRFSAASQVQWQYEVATGRYLRWQEQDATGVLTTHVDALTHQQIAAQNVVLLQVNQVNNFVPEDFRDGGNCGLEIQLWTLGPAYIFRDGLVYEGRWRRDVTTDMHLRLEDNNGNLIPLRPGKTWFDVVTLNAVLAKSNTLFTIQNKVPDTKSICPIDFGTPTPDPNATIDPNITPTP